MSEARVPFTGSYADGDIDFLLTPVTPDEAASLAEEPAHKERLIQRGERHYSQMITPEHAPSPAYQTIFDRALERHAERTGQDLAVLVRALDARIDGPVTLCSLVRAGVPPGVALTRGLRVLGRDVAHYGISIIRDRGMDAAALDHVLKQRPAAGLVFVDGWTGKGAISDELESTLADGWPDIAPRLVVLTDPAGRAWLAAGIDDWLIPSGLLGATVSGLVSRSILNERLTAPEQFHASVNLEHLAAHDVSRAFVDRICQPMQRALAQEPETLPPAVSGSATTRTRSVAVIDAVAREFSIANRNRIKPGLAEATRAVLRRAPARILVGGAEDDDLDALRHLARAARVPIEARGETLWPYRALTLIADASRA